MSRAPLLATPHLPGIGGRIKCHPADFIVEELPLYAASGTGEHVYLELVREGCTTRAMELALARCFDLAPHSIGVAGLKDKHARATQRFSLHLHRGEPAELGARVEAELGWKVLSAARHGNKLRAGHLLGNRFRVLVRDPEPDALARAQAIARELETHGLPNSFGPQRFGGDGRNAGRGRELFDRPRRGWTARLMASAWQSELFHDWLARRAERRCLPQMLLGDVAKRHDGPLFDVLDQEVEDQRRQRREIVPTGPLFGARMRWANGAAGEIEREVLAASGIEESALGRVGLTGSRRAAWIWPAPLALEPSDEGLWITLQLPKGSYATCVLREIQKGDYFEAAAPEGDEGLGSNDSEDQ